MQLPEDEVFGLVDPGSGDLACRPPRRPSWAFGGVFNRRLGELRWALESEVSEARPVRETIPRGSKYSSMIYFGLKVLSIGVLCTLGPKYMIYGYLDPLG